MSTGTIKREQAPKNMYSYNSFTHRGRKVFFKKKKKSLPCICYHFLPLLRHPRILMHPPAPSHKHTHTYTHSYTYTQAHICKQTHRHTEIHMHMNIHTCTHVYMLTHMCTHALRLHTPTCRQTHTPTTVFSKWLPSHC